MDEREEKNRFFHRGGVRQEGENTASRKGMSKLSPALFDNRKGKSGTCLQATIARRIPVGGIGGPDDVWLTAEEAAAYLKMPVGTLRNETSSGKLPHFKLGRKVRYSRLELSKLLLANARGR